MKIFQLPNKSALSWMASGFLYAFGNPQVKKNSFAPFVTSLGVWSFGEATKGVNKFRKALGWAGLVATAVTVLHNFGSKPQAKRR